MYQAKRQSVIERNEKEASDLSGIIFLFTLIFCLALGLIVYSMFLAP